jgi:hypothetical protein
MGRQNRETGANEIAHEPCGSTIQDLRFYATLNPSDAPFGRYSCESSLTPRSTSNRRGTKPVALGREIEDGGDDYSKVLEFAVAFHKSIVITRGIIRLCLIR